jgi:general secretion pathway protein J
MYRIRSGQRGFTLVELMIAISVLAMIAVLGWRGLDSIGRARTALNADLEQTDNQPSRVQVVAYRVVNGVLTRRESIATRDLTVLDSSWTSALADTDTSATQPVILQSGVNQMAIRTWVDDGAGWRTGTSALGSAVSQAPAATATPQPKTNGLEVSLSLRESTASLVKIFLLGAI